MEHRDEAPVATRTVLGLRGASQAEGIRARGSAGSAPQPEPRSPCDPKLLWSTELRFSAPFGSTFIPHFGWKGDKNTSGQAGPHSGLNLCWNFMEFQPNQRVFWSVFWPLCDLRGFFHRCILTKQSHFVTSLLSAPRRPDRRCCSDHCYASQSLHSSLRKKPDPIKNA